MTTATDNHSQWNGRDRGHYEVWYATWNDLATGDGYWLRYTLEAPTTDEPAYGQIWFARFCARDPKRSFAINRKLPIASVALHTDPFRVTLGGNRLAHDHAKGAVSGDGHAAEWDLT